MWRVDFFFCGELNISKLVSVDPTFIREMRVHTKIFRPQGADRGAITEPKEEGSGPLATKNRWWKIF